VAGKLFRVIVVHDEKLISVFDSADHPADFRQAGPITKDDLDGAALDIGKNSPTLNFGSIGICAIDGLPDVEGNHNCGFWGVDTISLPAIRGTVVVYQVIDSEAVSRWMKTQATRLTVGTTVVTEIPGVPAYVSTSQSPPSILVGKDKIHYPGQWYIER
jgi:hypothetical protein